MERLEYSSDDEEVDEMCGMKEPWSPVQIEEHRWRQLSKCPTPNQELPLLIKRRIKALKKIQLAYTLVETKFYEEIYALECKYALYYAPLYRKRFQIITGIVEPTDDDCDFPSDVDDEVNEVRKNYTDAILYMNVSGIPNFWYTVLKNAQLTAERIQEYDEPILKHLQDIRTTLSYDEPMGFTLEFQFEPNEYFTNTVLTKEYEIRCFPDEEDPFSFDGPEICSCKGCPIGWRQGKNVTVRADPRQSEARSPVMRTVTSVKNDSFFNFFSPPVMPDDAEQMDDDIRGQMMADFELGHYIRERVVSRAVLYFTGDGRETAGSWVATESQTSEEDEDSYLSRCTHLGVALRHDSHRQPL